MTSTAFEQHVHRIIELLEGSGATVTWDDHVPDPDNADQLRQIDITIRRDGKLTICECRLYRRKQNVKWIEELIGRRLSLHADAAIAVSSSGFTRGALKKGSAHAVILRDLESLSDADVAAWGRHVALTVYYYQYSNLVLDLAFAPGTLRDIQPQILQTELKRNSTLQTSMFNTAAEYIDSANLLPEERFGQEVKFGIDATLLETLEIAGARVIAFTLQGVVSLIRKPLEVHAVQAWRDPVKAGRSRLATVENYSFGETSIIHDKTRLSIFLDVSQLAMPPLSQFRFVRTEHEDRGEREVDHFEIAGIEKVLIPKGTVKVNVYESWNNARPLSHSDRAAF